jgi:hypothetical protein
MILGKIAMGMLGTVLVGGAILCSDGFISVRVNERAQKGSHMFFVVPGALAPVGMKFIPREHWNQVEKEVRPWLPGLRAAVNGIAEYPDTTFVEVIDRTDHVRVYKAGDSIVVDVDNPVETVHVSVPFRTIKTVVRELEEGSPPT